jgi:hypothetical protein
MVAPQWLCFPLINQYKNGRRQTKDEVIFSSKNTIKMASSKVLEIHSAQATNAARVSAAATSSTLQVHRKKSF